MAEKKKTKLIKLVCEKCKRINYYVMKSRNVSEKKLILKKYCRWCQKHTTHKEGK